MPKTANNTITFRMPKPVCRNAYRAIKSVMLCLSDVVDVRHDLAVNLVPALTVESGGEFGFGAFNVVDGKPEIWIAGQRIPDLKPAEFPLHILEVFFHELTHYEQWRDGRELTERGVAVRARNIMRQFDLEPLSSRPAAGGAS